MFHELCQLQESGNSNLTLIAKQEDGKQTLVGRGGSSLSSTPASVSSQATVFLPADTVESGKLKGRMHYGAVTRNDTGSMVDSAEDGNEDDEDDDVRFSRERLTQKTLASQALAQKQLELEESKQSQPSLAPQSLVKDDDDDNDDDSDGGSEEEYKEIKDEDVGAETITPLSALAGTNAPNKFAEVLSEDEESDDETVIESPLSILSYPSS